MKVIVLIATAFLFSVIIVCDRNSQAYSNMPMRGFCAHRGAINTLRYAQELTGVSMVYAVIGGTHLLHATEERVMLTAAAFREAGIQRLGVSHCTGLAAAVMLAGEFGDAFFFNNAGTQVIFP